MSRAEQYVQTITLRIINDEHCDIECPHLDTKKRDKGLFACNLFDPFNYLVTMHKAGVLHDHIKRCERCMKEEAIPE